jgi:hypothetical protein
MSSGSGSNVCSECLVIRKVIRWLIKKLMQWEAELQLRDQKKHHCKDTKLSLIPGLAMILGSFTRDLPACLVTGVEKVSDVSQLIVIRGGKSIDQNSLER